ncbi:MAG TPA: ATP synthase subunit C [Sphaerochaeta sp.]|jgi:V/A-type H+-transporting ATPase subunit K|nr:ATPase [Spirochaetales bacterium]OQA40140.1 MAG: V-type ATP synthase subunit K [Spirochaetes bacterium ADurb.Bin315]HPX28505.1 ATP synthase subunit C [Sphaerochaeta sp.]HQB54653.1 ATP synthase subunit C [Sphaerochaeta sp.]
MTKSMFRRKVSMSLVATALVLVGSGFIFAPGAYAATTEAVATTGLDYNLALVAFAASLAFSVGAISAGMAIGRVGSAAMGAMSERPEIGTQALIFIALAEGVVVFGFITSLMILAKV